jgi:Tfp pilus assembly protein PilO
MNRIRRIFALGSRLKRREKIVIMAGLVVAASILFYYFFERYQVANATLVESIRLRQTYLEKQVGRISEKSGIEGQLEEARAELAKFEERLLPGSKPPVAAAELQKTLKEMAASLTVEIRSERPLPPVEMNMYLGIPVEISFVSSTAKLRDLLFKIENSPLLLTVSDMKINVTNMANPTDIYAFLVVRGMIKKEQGTEIQPRRSANEPPESKDIEAWAKEQDKNLGVTGRRR